MSFSGKVALITGGGCGIGGDAARHLASLGAQISIVDLNEKGLNVTAENIKKCGGRVPLKIVADVTKDSERIVSETIKHFEKLDILINCAAISKRDTVCTFDISRFDEIFDVNVRSYVTLTKLCVPYLEKTKGNIINVSSECGSLVVPSLLTYCMSKAAVNQFTKCCSLDLASKGIRVNAIAPTAIRTPAFERFAQANHGIAKIPIGQVGEMSDTSAAIAFLANDQTASFLTGVLLPVGHTTG